MNIKIFIAVIGHANAGKSTVIQSLTGAKNPQFRGTVVDKTTGREIEVIGSSLQEMPIPISEFGKILSKAKASSKCNGVVCAIQPNRPRVRPDLEQILKEATRQGFSIHAYILSPGYNDSNAEAAIPRIQACSKKIDIQTLDGRRFGYINAEIINRKTGICALGLSDQFSP